VPAWQKRGIGILWEDEPHVGENPKTGAAVTTTRRRAVVSYDLPMKTEFEQLVRGIVERQ